MRQCTSGVLSLVGENGYTYGVPISYVYKNDKLYFHCAKSGHKIEALKKHNKISFTVIGIDKVLPATTSTCYKSAIAFGKASFVALPEEKRHALTLLVEKYSPQRKDECQSIITKKINAVQLVALDIEYMSGKEAIEFTKERKSADKPT